MSNDNTVTSLFSEGADSTLQSADAYSQVSNSIQNLYKDKVSPYMDDIVKSVGFDSSSILKTVKTVASGNFMKLNAKDKLDSLLRNYGTNLNSIKGKAMDRLFSDIGVNPKAIDEYSVKIGDTIKQVKNHDYSSLMGDSELLKGILGDETFSSIVNNDAAIAYAKNLLDIADRWGLPESVDTITAFIKEQNDDVVHAVFASYGSNTDGTYNLNVVEAILNGHESAAISMAANNPDLPNQICEQYHVPSDSTPNDYLRLAYQLESVLSKIAPYYLTGYRGNTGYVNLAPFTIMSDDAIVVMRTHPKYYQAACIRATYTRTDMLSELKEFYPYIAI